MILVDKQLLLVLLMFGAVAVIVAYAAGYLTASRDHYSVERRINQQLRFAQRQRNELARWAAENWPDEYAAYHRGIEEGYQQGLYHADELASDAEPEP